VINNNAGKICIVSGLKGYIQKDERSDGNRILLHQV
jgi:hypothetical protein